MASASARLCPTAGGPSLARLRLRGPSAKPRAPAGPPPGSVPPPDHAPQSALRPQLSCLIDLSWNQLRDPVLSFFSFVISIKNAIPPFFVCDCEQQVPAVDHNDASLIKDLLPSLHS